MAAQEDSLREMRAMILLSLPYPPLPVSVSRVEANEGVTCGEALTTTHTLIARCLNTAAVRNSPAENVARRARQTEIFQRFLHAMGTVGFFEPPEGVYRIYCDFSRQHIATYFPDGHPLDIPVQPLQSVCRGDPVHRKMAEYMAGQSIFYEDSPVVTREDYMRRTYAEMLLLLRHRLGHAMTEGEREALTRIEDVLD